MTDVEQQQQPATELSPEKQEIAEEEAAAAQKEKEEKKDEEKKETKETKEKKKKEKVAKPPPPPPVHKKDFEKDVVYMYQFTRTPALPSLSPACLKLETWLKLQGIKYENVSHNAKLRSKRGLLPFIELNGEEIADSELIIKELSKRLEKDMDADMSSQDKNIQHAMAALLDNHLHWTLTNWFNQDPNNAVKGYKINLQNMMGSKVPNSVLQFVMKHTYFKKSQKNVKAAGFGGYTDEELNEMGKEDLKVLSEFLGEKQFFFGDEPKSLDLRAFTWLALIINVDKEVPCPLRDFIESDCQNLNGLYNRMKERAWGDHWDEATGDKLDMNPHIPKPDPPKEEEKKEEEKKEEGEKKEEENKEESKDNKEEEKK